MRHNLISKILATCAAIAAAIFSVAARGDGRVTFSGPVVAEVQRVVDGDTIEVRAAIWLDQSVEVRVRIDGVDAPEMKSRCADERRRANAARDYLVRRLSSAQVRLTSVAYDKYGGRVRASVSDASGDIGSALVAKGYARAYHGERRQPWCPIT